MATAAVLLALQVGALPAFASTGYAPDSAHPTKALPGTPKGLAVDQSTGDIYAAIVSLNPNFGGMGEVSRYSSSLAASGTYAVGGGYYTGVALNPAGGFFANQMEVRETPLGNVGTSELDLFNSAGTRTGSFPLSYSDSYPTIASDSSGNVYLANASTHSVQVYSSGGTLLKEVTCSGCPGGAFGKPGSVAFDSAGNLYVADTNPDRVVKLAPSGGSYSYASTVQSGRGAGAVAVDPGNGDILVGDMPGGDNYHVVAYDSAGTQFDDFGAGLFKDASWTGYGALAAYQIAVDGSTHEVYVGDSEELHIFERTTIPAPAVTVEPPSQVRQLGAAMNATVDPRGHALLECDFEYTDEADFLANGFSAASDLPCPAKPGGSGGVQMSRLLSELTPGSAYRYRVTATSNGGSATSAAEKLETLPELPPVVTAEPAQSVTSTTATLAAQVNPRGGTVTDCHFEFGAGASYGTDFPCPSAPGWGTTDVSEARSVTGLAPATTYHYRLVVTTNAGTVEGEDVAFSTTAPPVEEEAPPAEGGAPAVEPAPAPAPAPAPPVTTIPPANRSSCRKGFRRKRVHGHARCVRVCPKGFRRRRVRRKVRCVRAKRVHRRRHRHHRRRAAR